MGEIHTNEGSPQRTARKIRPSEDAHTAPRIMGTPSGDEHVQTPRPPTPYTERAIPKDRRASVLVALGLLLVLCAAAYMAWGFIAPPVDPDVPPVAADGELPVPE